MINKINNLQLFTIIIFSIIISACSMPSKSTESTEGSDNQLDPVPPTDVGEDVEPIIQVQDETATNTEGKAILIEDFISAREYLVTYLFEQYGINSTDPWMEENITTADSAGVITYRYVSGPLSIEISAEASAPYPNTYTFQEVSNIANGFQWEGTLAFDGTIVESNVVPPWTILDTEGAQEAVLSYMAEAHNLAMPDSWADKGSSETERGTVQRSYISGSWLLTVEFAPAAPLVFSYTVIIDNSSEGICWEGEISGQGDISEISFSK